MRSKTSLLVFLWIVAIGPLASQEKGFLTTFSEADHSWLVADAIETTNGNFLVCAHDDWGASSLLLKLSAVGEILCKTIVAAEDTTINAHRLFQMPQDNSDEYMVLCPSQPVDGSTAALIFLHVDEDLNIVSRRVVPCSFFDEGNRPGRMKTGRAWTAP